MQESMDHEKRASQCTSTSFDDVKMMPWSLNKGLFRFNNSEEILPEMQREA